MSALEVKTCSNCGKSKPVTEYHRNRKAPSGLHSECKSCAKSRALAWHAEERERMGDEAYRAWRAESVRRSRRNNPEYANRNRAINKARHAALARLKAAHPDEYAVLYAAELERQGVDR